MTTNGLVPPPYDPKTLLTLYESNSTFWRCVHQLAIDTAGLGWSLQLREDKTESKQEFDRISEFLDMPNPDRQPLRKIFKQLLIDWGVMGWFGLEVARNNRQDVAEIYHVPGHTIKVHNSNKKYCQIRGTKKVWFKKYGSEMNISSKTGKEVASRADSANELIFHKNYYPRSDFYGAPNILSAIGDLMGLIGLRDYNLAFFENYGIPAALIVLEGEWEEGSEKQVTDFLNTEIKGTENAHKSLVAKQPDNCKFQYHKLGVEVKEASFKLYEKTRQENILVAYSMPPERVGIRVTGKLGGNVAEEATQIYVQGVVEPLQMDLEEVVNDMLLQSEIYKFKFDNIDLRDYDTLSERLTREVQSAVKTPNEARNELGLKPYEDGDKFYIAANMIEVGETDEDNQLFKQWAEKQIDKIKTWKKIRGEK